jgi:uracil-DNA glycosylase
VDDASRSRHAASGLNVSLPELLEQVRACQACAHALPLGPRPVLQMSESARLLIVSQAPGSKVHHSGIPWNDSSGDRLRHWLEVDVPTFYDSSQVALVPIGLCYPGAAAGGGDNPPRPECADLWHDRLIARLPRVELMLLVGQYAQQRHLGSGRKRTLTQTVGAFQEYGPKVFPLPHPSWRSVPWMQKNPWFEEKVLPELRAAVQNCTAPACSRSRADRDHPEVFHGTKDNFMQRLRMGK